MLLIEVPRGFGGTHLIDHLCTLRGWNDRAIEIIDGRETEPTRASTSTASRTYPAEILSIEVDDLRGKGMGSSRIDLGVNRTRHRIVLHDERVARQRLIGEATECVWQRLEGILPKELPSIVSQWVRSHPAGPVSGGRRDQVLASLQRRMMVHHRHRDAYAGVSVATVTAWLQDADRTAVRSPVRAKNAPVSASAAA